MADYGEPRSYLDIDDGIDVITSDGQVLGALEHVLADDQAVVLKLAAAEAESLHEPSDNPAVMQHGGEEDSEGPLAQKLRRAWDLVSGRY